ncbi:hypothetical protein [Sphingobium aquiterrae]|uniref:hypothetical protein n=1 Tax=Sphingobium aquiterrae TaxID=2038656 RepID=UPI00301A3D25
MAIRPFIPSLALLLGGCAVGSADGVAGYPSLARRPIERQEAVAEASAPAPVATADDALATQLKTFSAQAHAGATAFDRSYGDADRLARKAAGADVSSEAWVAAQVALSDLESARNDSVSALASLDTLYVERANAIADGKAPGGLEAIDLARADALSIVDAQNDRLDAMKAVLRQP